MKKLFWFIYLVYGFLCFNLRMSNCVDCGYKLRNKFKMWSYIRSLQGLWETINQSKSIQRYCHGLQTEKLPASLKGKMFAPLDSQRGLCACLLSGKFTLQCTSYACAQAADIKAISSMTGMTTRPSGLQLSVYVSATKYKGSRHVRLH